MRKWRARIAAVATGPIHQMRSAAPSTQANQPAWNIAKFHRLRMGAMVRSAEASSKRLPTSTW